MVSLVPTGLWQLLKLLLFFMMWTVLRHPGKIFCRMSFSLVCLMFFSWLDWDCEFGGRVPQRWTTVLITDCAHYVSQEMINLITWYISLIGMLHKYHRLGSLNNRDLFYHSFGSGSSRSMWQQGWFLLRILSPACRQLPFPSVTASSLFVSMS